MKRSSKARGPLTWGDTHHPALSETNGEYDGRWLFINEMNGRVARIDLRAPERALGRTTEECLRVGVIWGNAGLVDALVRRITAELPIEKVGGKLRDMMPWIRKNRLVDTSKN